MFYQLINHITMYNLDVIITSMDVKNLTTKIYNSCLIFVEHKLTSLEDEQEMLREGHAALIEETKRLKSEDNTL